MPEIVALGEPMAEFAATERGRLSTVTMFRRGWGGDTSNFIVAASRLGATCGYLTRVGGDEFGQSFLDLWAREGVDTSGVVVEPGGFTAVYFIALDRDGRHSFTYYRAGSAASRLAPQDVAPGALRGARVAHTSGITQAISDSARAAAVEFMQAARAHGVAVSYDANVRPRLRPLDEQRVTITSAFAQADVVFLSSEDAAHLYGDLTPDGVTARVLERGARLAVLRQGAAGCLVATADGARAAVPGWPVEAVDATGAGDAFNAGFLVEWLRGADVEQAAVFANAVGALTTLGPGAVAPIPTRAAVETFMREMHATREGRRAV
ncbi:MAG: sugar kinase [Armatimonadota bacterium]|nr:sugar kinase [Armatimonadota bacterium]